MKEAVLGFEEVTQELQQFAGGKGAVLSMLYQRGFPVPEGLVVLPEAMPGGSVKQEARELILSKINVIRKTIRLPYSQSDLPDSVRIQRVLPLLVALNLY